MTTYPLAKLSKEGLRLPPFGLGLQWPSSPYKAQTTRENAFTVFLPVEFGCVSFPDNNPPRLNQMQSEWNVHTSESAIIEDLDDSLSLGNLESDFVRHPELDGRNFCSSPDSSSALIPSFWLEAEKENQQPFAVSARSASHHEAFGEVVLDSEEDSELEVVTAGLNKLKEERLWKRQRQMISSDLKSTGANFVAAQDHKEREIRQKLDEGDFLKAVFHENDIDSFRSQEQQKYQTSTDSLTGEKCIQDAMIYKVNHSSSKAVSKCSSSARLEIEDTQISILATSYNGCESSVSNSVPIRPKLLECKMSNAEKINLSNGRTDKSREAERVPLSSPAAERHKGSLEGVKAVEANKRLITHFFASPQSSVQQDRGPREKVQHKKIVQAGPEEGGKASWRSRWQRRATQSRRGHGDRESAKEGVKAWECVPGTPFRVDGFRNLSSDCSHWFLTHFHTDRYQGITRGFRHGTIYCSAITAQLLTLKVGLPPAKLRILPLQQTVAVEGVGVTLLDANHCPGAVIILFQPPNGQLVLHTGDFRWSPAMQRDLSDILVSQSVHTLILDTTFCNPRYKFPSQEVVLEYVIDMIAAELFSPKTLCLIGTDTVGTEKLFLQVGKSLKKKVYVGGAKQRLLSTLNIPEDCLQWITSNEAESSIHAVPMWSVASFKRMESLHRHYKGKYDTLVAFSPSGWSLDCEKQRLGKRTKRGTLIRYEVPYSEHSNFKELQEFVEVINPVEIIPSVHCSNTAEAESLVDLLLTS